MSFIVKASLSVVKFTIALDNLSVKEHDQDSILDIAIEFSTKEQANMFEKAVHNKKLCKANIVIS